MHEGNDNDPLGVERERKLRRLGRKRGLMLASLRGAVGREGGRAAYVVTRSGSCSRPSAVPPILTLLSLSLDRNAVADAALICGSPACSRCGVQPIFCL
jgi:hypothetical protein